MGDVNRRAFVKSCAATAFSLGWARRMSWAADTSAAGSLKFVYYTDIHARLEWDTPRAMELAADAINAQGCDLAICGGDVITDGFEFAAEFVAPRWEAYFEKLHHRINAPVHAMIGNHDLVAAMPKDGSQAAADPKAIFRKKMNLEKTYRSFDWRGYHFVLLDSIEVTRDELKYRGYVDADQLAWLKNDVANVSPDTPIIAAIHMPLLTGFYQATEGSSAPGPANRVVVNNRDVLAAFEGRNLLLVLQGHLHVDEMLRWRKTTFITGGAVCGQWWRGPWQGTEEGFGVVKIENGRVNWEYIAIGWEAQRPTGV